MSGKKLPSILVLTADDLIESRGATRQSPRDNVLLELGLFIGRLGTRRTFAVYDREAEIKLPSDLAGVTMADYRPHYSGDLEAALGAPCTKIKRSIEKQGKREGRSAGPAELASRAMPTEPEGHREQVANKIRAILDSLRTHYEEAATVGRQHSMQEFPDKDLKKCKYNVLKFLDANFQADEAAPFAALHSTAGTATPLAHLSSSYEERRDFLEALCEEVKDGRGEFKIPPRPSGNRLPIFGTFAYKN